MLNTIKIRLMIGTINNYNVAYATDKPEYKTEIDRLANFNTIKMNATAFKVDDFAELSEMTYTPYFVILDEDKVIGFFSVTIHSYPQYATMSYCVAEDYRKKRLGTGILMYITKLLKCHNIKYLMCITFSNIASENCLKKFGFKPAGFLPERYRYFDGEKNVIIDQSTWLKKIK